MAVSESRTLWRRLERISEYEGSEFIRWNLPGEGDAAVIDLHTGGALGFAKIFLNGKEVRTFDCYSQPSGSVTYDSREKIVRVQAIGNGRFEIREIKYQDQNGDWHTIPFSSARFFGGGSWSPYGGSPERGGWVGESAQYMATQKAGAYFDFSFLGKAAVARVSVGNSEENGEAVVFLDGVEKSRFASYRPELTTTQVLDWPLYVEGEKTGAHRKRRKLERRVKRIYDPGKQLDLHRSGR